MSKKYALVMTCTEGLHINANAAFNGLALYGNDIDIHLLSKDINKDYISRLPSYFTVPDWKTQIVDPNKPAHKGGGWEVRYYRYSYVRTIKDQYDAILTMDADVFVVGNLMEHFERAAKEGVLIMPDNPQGCALDRANLDNIKGASSPPYHCHPFFFDPKKYDWLMAELYQAGITEDYGDMATLFRTLYRHNLHKDVVALPNDLWCFTNWHADKMQFEMKDGLPLLTYKNGRVVVVHRRWYLPEVRDKFVRDLGPQHREDGTHNVQIFKDVIEWLNNNGPIKL